MSVQPAQFRILAEVLNQRRVVLVVFVRQDPPNMGPPEATLQRRMDISLPVCVPMMHAMVSGPPEDALLARGLSHKCHQELPPTPQLVGAVAEIAVVSRGNGKHTNTVRSQHEHHPRPPERDKE